MPRVITWLLTSMYYTPDRLPINVQWGLRSELKDDHVIFSILCVFVSSHFSNSNNVYCDK